MDTRLYRAVGALEHAATLDFTMPLNAISAFG
jgi:hypothetical protein